MTILQSSVLLGSQKPRVRSCPEYQFTSGPAAVAIYETTGNRLDQWQREGLDDHCAENADGSWVTIESAEEVSRQNGKGEEINALFLLHLFVLGTRMIIYSAHEFKTAKETYLKIYALIRNTPELHEQVAHYYNSNENTSIELTSGQRLRFMTRSKSGGIGFTGDVIIFDEAFNIPQSVVTALMPTLSSKKNPHIYFFSSAGRASSESDVLRALKERGEKGDTTLVWRSFSADPNCDTDSKEALAQANPAYNVRITDRFVDVERKNMTDAGFRRERLGIWEEVMGAGSVISAESWGACYSAFGIPEGTPLSAGVAISPDRAWASVSFAWQQLGGAYVDLAKHEAGIDWLIPYLVDISERRSITSVTVDLGGPAATLLPSMGAAGLKIRLTDTAAYKVACAGMVDAITYKRVHHRGQAELTTAAVGVRERKVQDSWVFDRRNSGCVISPLESATLAIWGLVPDVSKKEFFMQNLGDYVS